MALRNFLIHRCTVERASATRGEAGEEVVTWAAHLVNVACRLVIESERQASGDGFLTATTHKLLLPAGGDVTTADRVSEVVLEDLAVEGPFDVEAVLRRRDRKGQRHVTLMLKGVD